MIIYENQLEYLIKSANRMARMRGFIDPLRMPLEWRPAGGITLLMEYANGTATLARDTRNMTARDFINAYGAYIDEENNIRHSAIAAKAFEKLAR